MSKNLVIVESPAKAKTIEKFLGKDFKVMSSYGHIRDLQKKDFSIDTTKNYRPVYVIPDDKKELVKQLKAEAKKADIVWLASDEDREGEAIAWHLYEVLGLTAEKTKRIVFHEITKDAILNAIKNPRGIDMDRVNAQQARRVLDRIVGFELSPVLWKKIKPALSAGRVQSVAVRLIVEREKEIRNFQPEEYYRVTAVFSQNEKAQPIRAELNTRLKTKEEAQAFLEACAKSTFSVTELTVKPATKTPAPPFTTSTLQQEASRKLGFSVAQTMSIAQRLYESGLITYMRTDSVNLSELALSTTCKEIKDEFGDQYYKRRTFHTTSKGAQEAHEAIRPTYASNRDISGTPQEKRLYDLIWKRTIATQMADAILEKTTVEISMSERKEKFIATGEVVKFEGFLHVYKESNDEESSDDKADESRLPALATVETLLLKESDATQRFTQQPPRYTEAMLVRKLEELGIGRPSTYAPTISTIQNRDYVEKGEKTGEKHRICTLSLNGGTIKESFKTESYGSEKNKLIPTDVGMVVNDFLQEYFPDIMDYNFTANVEEKFDHIAAGESKWNDEIAQFYDLFHPEVEKVSNLRLEHKVGERVLGVDPKTGKEVSVKIGRFGPLVQLGTADSTEKPAFASLRKDQSVNDITLEEALKLFELPRMLGIYEGDDVSAAIGRFGPYVKYGNKYVSIPKGKEAQTISLEEAIDLIKAKEEAAHNKIVKKFDEEPDLEILNGPYGVYISYKKKNYKIPKDKDATALTLDECKTIIEDAANAPKKTRRAAVRRKTK
ncbi:MAG TPA: type I DNA topoisomerase [Candidatus Limisoma intestinavium]|uniref:DNA topoisomerase 1 n=1 Tax=Candidatus Limisoma intestinavium TaxID=2840856 RepID=A0A9D1INV2_9BACT|nr:type I DNA topoisomerase [Candidatus Limisoma intestinavium]